MGWRENQKTRRKISKEARDWDDTEVEQEFTQKTLERIAKRKKRLERLKRRLQDVDDAPSR